MDRNQLCNSLLTWLQTFGIEGTQSISIEELCDGVVMSRALHQISPNFFSDAWMLKIKHDVGSNWRLKVSNLKKILQGVLDYYSEVLGQQLQDFIMPDISAIGEHSNREELSRLLQLILGCAINCETKEDYIQNIMSLEESVQHSVMNAIKELMSKGSATSPSDNDTAEQVRKLTEELADMTNQKEEIAHRCHELDLQVNALQEEKANLIADNERMNDRVNASDSMDDPSTPIGRRHQQLANQVEQLQEELYRLEAARDDYRLKVEIQSKEIQELNRKNENLNELADEARTLKDEMDELRHTQDKVEKYEANIETYKKKLEEMQDLKGQIKVLEEKNSGYMDTNMTLEEELRKCQSVRSQMEVYKRQMSDLQARCSEETRRADRAEFEAKRGSEKVSTLQREKERVTSERDSLREINEELRCTQVQKDTLLGEGNSQMFDDSNLDLSTLPTAVRERIIRLQHENKMLKQDRSEADQAEVLQTMLDDAQKRSNELQSEVRISNQRIMELEAQIEDFTESTEKSSASDQATVTNMRSKLNSAQQTINKQQEEMRERKQKMEEVESTLGDSESCVVQLRQQLFRKEEEMKGMEERYKRYLDKAKSVSRSDCSMHASHCTQHCSNLQRSSCCQCIQSKCCEHHCHGHRQGSHECDLHSCQNTGVHRHSFHSSNLSLTGMGQLTHDPPVSNYVWSNISTSTDMEQKWSRLTQPIVRHSKVFPTSCTMSDAMSDFRPVGNVATLLTSNNHNNNHVTTDSISKNKSKDVGIQHTTMQSVGTQTRRIQDSRKIGSPARNESMSSNNSNKSGCAKGLFKPEGKSKTFDYYYKSKSAGNTPHDKFNLSRRTVSTSNVSSSRSGTTRMVPISPISESYPTPPASEAGDSPSDADPPSKQPSLFAHLLGVYLAQNID